MDIEELNSLPADEVQALIDQATSTNASATNANLSLIAGQRERSARHWTAVGICQWMADHATDEHAWKGDLGMQLAK